MHVLRTGRQLLYVPVDPPPGITDITVYDGEIALIPDNGAEPEEADWHAADWIGGKLALLIGPGGNGVEYPAGEYMAFARVTAGVERPVMTSGRVRIGLGR